MSTGDILDLAKQNIAAILIFIFIVAVIIGGIWYSKRRKRKLEYWLPKRRLDIFSQVQAITFDHGVEDGPLLVNVADIENYEQISPRFLNGKRTLLLEKINRPLVEYNSEQSLNLDVDGINYREWEMSPLPDEHKALTPEWLHQGIMWDNQARELEQQSPSNLQTKISLGLAIAIIFSAMIALFLVVTVAVG